MLEKYIKSDRKRFIINRIIRSIPVLFIASFVAFSLMHVGPVEPARRILGAKASQEQIASFNEEHGLNAPLYEQYFNWMKNAIQGDLGTSFRYGEPVGELILARLPLTVQLMATALLISIILGVTMGVIGALKHNTILDYIATVQALFWRSAPSFWVGLIFLLYFSMRWGLFPASYEGYYSLILPAFVLGLRLQAIVSRLTRSSMLNVMNKDYIKTAETKGLKKYVVIIKHGLRNALIPVVTIIAMRIPWLFGGAMITEQIFNLPGMGRLILMGVNKFDFPLVQGSILFITFLAVVANAVADIGYTFVDPRIDITRTEEEGGV